MEPTAPLSLSKSEGNWWTRNWKWFVPTGCLTMILFVAAFVSLIFMIAVSAMKTSDAYREALARARASDAVVEALGSPIKDGLFVSGNTNVNGASGEANLAIPLSGPKGIGTLYVAATKSVGVWNYSNIVLEVKQTRRRIDLLHESK